MCGPGCGHLPVGVAEPEHLPVVERFVDGVRGDRLVEVFGETAARVASGDGVGVRGAGRNTGTPRLR